ncbi:MAG: DUF4271 domain-containing protein [Bacteroidales bacterium]|nr:DUF4271 domain-containing protein [Candidatus Cacconaster equi]
MMNLLDMAVEPWEGSMLVLKNVTGTTVAVQSLSDKILILCVVLCLAVLVFFFKIYMEGVISSAQTCMSYNRASETFNNKRAINSMYLAFVLSVPFYALAISRSGVSAMKEWWVLVTISLFFIFRHLAYVTAGWLTAKKEPFKVLENTATGCFVLIMSLSILALAAVELFPSIDRNRVAIYLATVYGIGILVYFARSFKIFGLSGFSIIFWFLYLCSLEILPMCVAGNVLLTNGH